MTSSLAQPSFSRGEIAIDLSGRTDLATYQTALRQCRNFMVSPYGGILNRPGTVFLAETPGNEVARMIRFKFNNQDAYALEFSHLLMRVYRNGGLVLNSAGPDIGLPFELATPFTRDELFSINFTQSGDIMDMVHRNHKPQKLKRFDHDNWTISDVSLVPSIAAPATATATGPGGTGNTQSWKFQITAVIDDGSNSIEESLPVTSNTVTVYASNVQATVVWDAVVGASYYNIYKDNAGSGIYGFIGKAETLTFTDNNITPTKTDTPPTGLDPFIGAGNYPGAVTYYQQRLVYGGSLNNPQTLWFSRTGVPTNFSYSTPVKDDDAITWTMASLEVNQIMHLAPLRSLIPFTDGAEWTVQGSSAGFTPRTINGDAQSYNGIGQVRPLLIGSNAIYAQERGREITSFGYTLEADGFSGRDISIFSPHLLQENGLSDWDYQKIPYHVVWGVRDDGDLVGLTYLPSQEVTGWHHHDTDGKFLSVCSVPEGREDSMYFCAERTIDGATKRYVERMASRMLPTYDGRPITSQAYFVDCGLTYDGGNLDMGFTVTVTGGTAWQYPESLTMTASAALFTAGDVGNQIQFRSDPTADPFSFNIIAYTSSTVVTVRPLGVVPELIRGVAFASWYKALDNFQGLGHLEGKTVSILADGNVVPQQVVTGGEITIPSPAAVVHIGLPYQSVAETLSINVPGEETLIDKTKIISEVTLLLKDSRGGLVGAKESTLFEMKQRSEADGYGSIQPITGTASAFISDTWNGTGRFLIVQNDPLPMNILSVIPRADAGGAR